MESKHEAEAKSIQAEVDYSTSSLRNNYDSAIAGLGSSVKNGLKKCESGVASGTKYVRENPGMTAAAVATGVTAVVAAPSAIAALGFGTNGTNVMPGSIFASLQSAGVLGLATSTKAVIGVGAAAAVPVSLKAVKATKDATYWAVDAAASTTKAGLESCAAVLVPPAAGLAKTTGGAVYNKVADATTMTTLAKNSIYRHSVVPQIIELKAKL